MPHFFEELRRSAPAKGARAITNTSELSGAEEDHPAKVGQECSSLARDRERNFARTRRSLFGEDAATTIYELRTVVNDSYLREGAMIPQC